MAIRTPIASTIRGTGSSKWRRSLTLSLALLAAAAAQGGEPQQQTFAPHELNDPASHQPSCGRRLALRDGPIDLESAEERHLRVVVMTTKLEQPWSMAFLPDGTILVTERAGRLRAMRHGKLERDPVPGVPEVYTGGPRGLQGLMDVVLHPRFIENGWNYLTYHKPAGDGGSTALARGTWDGTALTGVQTIFDSAATDTEASRIA